MGCGTSNDVVPKDYSPDDEKPPLPQSPNLKKDYPIAFEVPFEDLTAVAKKPLPQKLQRLREQRSPEPEETLKMLRKKLADADQRRQQILTTRINSAHRFHLKTRSDDSTPKEIEVQRNE